MNLNTVECADALDYLATLPDESVHCVVTSPPYFGLRRYLPSGHADEDREIGSEPTPAAFVEAMVKVFREVRRVLRSDGVLFLNLGDSYSSDEKWGGHSTGKQEYIGQAIDGARERRYTGLSGKNLIGVPWRVTLAMQANGWILRSAAPWLKVTAMPESVLDRPTTAHEYVFQFAKTKDYWFDAQSVKKPSKTTSIARAERGVSATNKLVDGAPGQVPHSVHQPRENVRKQDKGGRQYAGFNDRYDAAPVAMRNRRTTDTFNEALDDQITALKEQVAHLEYVKSNGGVIVDGDSIAAFLVNPEASTREHYASFPRKLVEPCVLSSCPDKCCSKCGKPWVRVYERTGAQTQREQAHQPDNTPTKVDSTGWQPVRQATDRFEPQCQCGVGTQPGIVLDPFAGSGTTLVVAAKLGRHYLGCDLSQVYVDMAQKRLSQADPTQDKELKSGMTQLTLFNEVIDGL